jgi:hypothetical protein
MVMAITLSPLDVWKIFKDSKRSDKQEIAAWLDAVAGDARDMAEIWAEVYQRYCAGNEDQRAVLHRANALASNRAPYYRLREFYKSASQVIGARVKRNFHDDFDLHIGSVLDAREAALRAYQVILYYHAGVRFFVEDDNYGRRVYDFKQAIEALNSEAAAIEVLAKNFRASDA